MILSLWITEQIYTFQDIFSRHFFHIFPTLKDGVPISYVPTLRIPWYCYSLARELSSN